MSIVVAKQRTGPPAPERRVRLSGVDWQTFWSLATKSRGGRLTFDRGVLEIMSPGPLHEAYNDLLADFVSFFARGQGIPRKALGSTTWGREQAARGLEADKCFYLTTEKIELANEALARKSNDSGDYPAPDLAIEVDISDPEIDRAEIYATIGVPEVWRFDGDSVVIEQLQADLTYVRAEESRFLGVSSLEIRRWIVEENSSDQTAWEDRLAEWARRRSKA